jgi:hypothetical protein
VKYAFPIVSMDAVSFNIFARGTPRSARYVAIAVDSCSKNPPFASGGGLCGVALPARTT